jgi:hypothetical protein
MRPRRRRGYVRSPIPSARRPLAPLVASDPCPLPPPPRRRPQPALLGPLPLRRLPRPDAARVGVGAVVPPLRRGGVLLRALPRGAPARPRGALLAVLRAGGRALDRFRPVRRARALQMTAPVAGPAAGPGRRAPPRARLRLPACACPTPAQGRHSFPTAASALTYTPHSRATHSCGPSGHGAVWARRSQRSQHRSQHVPSIPQRRTPRCNACARVHQRLAAARPGHFRAASPGWAHRARRARPTRPTLTPLQPILLFILVRACIRDAARSVAS